MERAMTTQHRQQPSRLHIPPFLNPQIANSVDARTMFSPALHTGSQSNFPSGIPLNNALSLQTPMQASFFPPPNVSSRPPNAGHRSHSSLAHLAGGMMGGPPSIVPMTPLGQSHFLGGQGQAAGFPSNPQPFVPKSRRTPSSIGGPPKAPLGGPGGPARKVSPLPSSAVLTIQEKLKAKKVVVKLPVESIREDQSSEDVSPSKSLWTRKPVPSSEVEIHEEILPPEIASIEIYPDIVFTHMLPPTVDVFLPGKAAWDEMKQRIIDEKLEKLGLGIEKRPEFAPPVPEIHAAHARATSISSPADPALLYFKLNKLQQSQQAALSSSSTSPHLPSSSTSPNPPLPLRLQKHGHSMSLAQAPAFQVTHPFSSAYEPLVPPNILEVQSDGSPLMIAKAPSPLGIHAPQGRAPVHLMVQQPSSRPESTRPDFIRGFGVDIPEEEEPEEESPVAEEGESKKLDVTEAVDGDITKTSSDEIEKVIEAHPQSVDDIKQGTHTRHASRISVALSVGSTSKRVESHDGPTNAEPEVLDDEPTMFDDEPAKAEQEVDDAVNEWTGSEDQRSDSESIGEWSNPSDEEKARQNRAHRRAVRRAQEEMEQPRRIPNFPRPPEDPFGTLARDDDVISNPSDEELPGIGYRRALPGVFHAPFHPQAMASIEGRIGRPLPPLPHSRNSLSGISMSGSFASHSPSPSRDLQNSRPVSRPESAQHATSTSISSSRRNSLNPFAKPFVFGARPATAPIAPSSDFALSPVPNSAPSHSRIPSLSSNRVLNVAAQEFKPGRFTFQAPGEAPALSFSDQNQPSLLQNEVPRPLPDPPVETSSIALQGREKRMRRSESLSSSEDDEDGNEDTEGLDTMASFRFPNAPEPTMVFHRSAPASPLGADRAGNGLGAGAKPVTFSGFPNMHSTDRGSSLAESMRSGESDLLSSMTTDKLLDDEERVSPELSLPSSSKQKRAPIPLDFKHPMSTNMVPAGLFKNLGSADADDRTRTGRMGSLDYFDVRSEASLDDESVPPISQAHKVMSLRGRLPNREQLEDLQAAVDAIEDSASRLSAAHSRHSSRESIVHTPPSGSIVPPDMGSFNQSLRIERRLEEILDRKLDLIRQEFLDRSGSDGGRYISASTDEMVKEAMAMFRAQLGESAINALDDSRMDARGELDLEMLKSFVEQSNDEARKKLRDDVAELLQAFSPPEAISRSVNENPDLTRLVHDIKANIMASNSHVVDRLSTIESLIPYHGVHQEREALVFEILSALTPHLTQLQNEPIDYDGLTIQLTQAVKPHIAQLIDLASDKRETAELIANRLMPILQSLATNSPPVDTESLVSEITANVNRIIAPIDTHTIKEQVADLVVERLDARLAVRDNALNFDNLKSKIAESLVPLFGRLENVDGRLENLAREQSNAFNDSRDAFASHAEAIQELSNLEEQLGGVTESLGEVQSLLVQQQDVSDERAKHLERIEAAFEALATSGVSLGNEKEEIIASNRQLLDTLSPLPASVNEVLQTLDSKYGDILSRVSFLQDLSQEMRKNFFSTTELQSQLAKARAAHGQIRVEKDNLNEKLLAAESERDKLRMKIEELQNVAVAKAEDYVTLEVRTADQERAMHAALDRLKTSDITIQTQQERIAELEKQNRELMSEKQRLKSKVDGFEMQIEFAARDKESAQQSIRLLQADRDHLASQQSQWDDLKRATEQIEILTKIVGEVESEEVKELKRNRDRSKVLEGEHAALQKRYKEQEAKIANIERASVTARQSLAQAQQRSSEWEKKAREFEGEVERLTTTVEQAEQTKGQLDADYSFAKLQIEELEAEQRLAKDRERKLAEEVAALKTQLSDIKSELEEAKKTPNRSMSGSWSVGGGENQRSSSPVSTAYVATPTTPRLNGKGLPHSGNSMPVPLVRPSTTMDSMHAPRNTYPPTPRASRMSASFRAPSPTPSVASTVLTKGNDGWWS